VSRVRPTNSRIWESLSVRPSAVLRRIHSLALPPPCWRPPAPHPRATLVFRRLLRNIGPIDITDDRGQSRPLVQAPDPWPRMTWWGRAKGDVDAAMRAEAEWAQRWGEAWGVIVGLFTIFGTAWARSLFSTGAGWPAWAGSLAVSLLLALGIRQFAPLVARYYRVGSAAELRRAYRSVNRCASCGYALAGLAPKTDRCVVCPECGSAWRV